MDGESLGESVVRTELLMAARYELGLVFNRADLFLSKGDEKA